MSATIRNWPQLEVCESEIFYHVGHLGNEEREYEAQLSTYMNLADVRFGFIINFNMKK